MVIWCSLLFLCKKFPRKKKEVYIIYISNQNFRRRKRRGKHKVQRIKNLCVFAHWNSLIMKFWNLLWFELNTSRIWLLLTSPVSVCHVYKTIIPKQVSILPLNVFYTYEFEWYLIFLGQNADKIISPIYERPVFFVSIWNGCWSPQLLAASLIDILI